jgi:chromosomal replication initiator protein
VDGVSVRIDSGYRGGGVTEPVDCAAVWGAATDLLMAEESLSQQRRAYLRLTSLRAIVEDTALLAVPDAFTRDVIETQLRTHITEALSKHLGRTVQVAVTIRPPEESARSDPRNAPTAAVAVVPVPRPARETPPAGGAPGADSRHHGGQHHRDDRVRPTDGNRLNPKYTFETFVVGASNRFAQAAAFAVSESPAKAYNPLFIYGGSGLGKTHLLHAIGNYAVQLGTAKVVRYVSTEEFTNDFINSVRDDRSSAFQRRYRDDVDILLIDDIQFLENRERTQEEFFHTFNTLHNASKQIVITSDRKPKDLATLEDRLRTRFEWGLLADVTPPDLETRIAILQKKQAQERLGVPKEILEFIASRITQSIRELEGALLRVTAFASLNRSTIDLGLAEEVLRDFIPDGNGPEVTAEQIMDAVSEYFGVSGDDLRGQSRSRVLVNARQVAMYLCRELTDLSLPRIGQAFGGRDHTTVMHADRKIRQLMAERRTLFNQIADLTNRIKQQSG